MTADAQPGRSDASGEAKALGEVFDRLSVPTFIRDALTEAIAAERVRAVREAKRDMARDVWAAVNALPSEVDRFYVTVRAKDLFSALRAALPDEAEGTGA